MINQFKIDKGAGVIQKTTNQIKKILFLGPFVALQSTVPPPKGVDSKWFRDLEDLFGGTNKSPAGARTLGDLITLIVQILLIVAGSIAVIFLIVGGYRYITAHGNEEQMEAAKKTMTGAIIGLVIITVAFAIVSIIIRVLLGGVEGTGLQ